MIAQARLGHRGTRIGRLGYGTMVHEGFQGAADEFEFRFRP